MILTPSPVSSAHFDFEKEKFFAFASDLGPSFDYGRVYDDACDYGFTIVSEKTGKKAVFAIIGELTNDGDLEAWYFQCVTPGLKNLKAVIFND